MIYYRVPHVFTPSELDLAITMARQVAQAIEHQKDTNALRQRERELARELAGPEATAKIGSQMIKQQQIEAVYTQIVEATMALLRSDCGSMQMVLPETGELLLLAQKGFAAGSANGWQRISRNGGTTCAKAFRSGERVIVPDLEQCHFVKKRGSRFVSKVGNTFSAIDAIVLPGRRDGRHDIQPLAKGARAFQTRAAFVGRAGETGR